LGVLTVDKPGVWVYSSIKQEQQEAKMDNVSMLMHFGLTRQEATIYIDLLKNGEMTGYEIAKRTGISRSNVYTSLAGLVEKGAAYLIEGKAAKYLPVSTSNFCDDKIRQLSQMKERLLENDPPPEKEVQGYATITNSRHVLNKIKNLINETGYRVYISAADAILEKVTDELVGAIERNVKVLIITNPPFMLEGAQVYHSPSCADQLRIIVDSQYALTGDYRENDDCSCLYSSKKNLVDLIKDALKNEIRLITLTGHR
jgi:sugar-specific transcriptional regulator TrmB